MNEATYHDMLDMLDRIHSAMEMRTALPDFNEIGTLIAIAKGDIDRESVRLGEVT